MISLLRTISLVVLCCATVGSRSFAQGKSSTTVKSCSEAARFIQHGVPGHKQLAALDYLAQCGLAGASTLAETVLQSRTEQDIEALSAFYVRLQAWRDSSVMEAAADVASDPAAAVPSRVFAIGYLLWITNPGYQYPYLKLVEGIAVPHLPCVAGYTSAHPSSASVGTPLPRDYAEKLGTLLRQMSANSASPREVRNAASCVEF